MPKIVPIVEGTGEVEAVPVLLSKILRKMERFDITVARVRNAHSCSNLTKNGGLEAFINLASQEPECGAVMVLMDADKDCPLTLAQDFTRRIQARGTKYSVVTVIARCEYEAWFLASLDTIAGRDLDGRPGLPHGLTYDLQDVETLVDVKGWLDRNLPGSRIYKETLDQVIMTRFLDVELVEARSRSFRRLLHAVEEAVAAIDAASVVVTPAVPPAVNPLTSKPEKPSDSRKAKGMGRRHKR